MLLGAEVLALLLQLLPSWGQQQVRCCRPGIISDLPMRRRKRWSGREDSGARAFWIGFAGTPHRCVPEQRMCRGWRRRFVVE